MKIRIRVILTNNPALAQAVYISPDRPGQCGIALERPENIWSLSLPDDCTDENNSVVNTL